ncbi:MAG: ABC transporter ATP-binding protein [Tissierellia bacterium]|nr:ABC transporter ATP-binding protein [Tissierellia bacterium]
MSSIKIENISKNFDNTSVLENFSLYIKDKELISLIGPSGSGKTTILKIISGILNQDSGRILLDGRDISSLKPEDRDAVIVFQDYLLFPHMTVFDNIAFGLKMRGRSKKEIQNKVNKLLDMVKLKEYGKAYPKELSGGQKQRVALARALAVKPKVLLLDEPFSNLDPTLRSDMRNLLLELQRKTEITTILVTHDKDEAMIVSDRIALLMDKNVEQFDTAHNIYSNPSSKKVADFFGQTNYIEGEIKSGSFKSKNINLKVNHIDCINASLMLRPEDIIPGNSGINAIITKKEYRGDRTLYQVKVDSETLYMLTDPYDNYSIGESLKINIKQKSPIIFCD